LNATLPFAKGTRHENDMPLLFARFHDMEQVKILLPNTARRRGFRGLREVDIRVVTKPMMYGIAGFYVPLPLK
jgi:hypothetical protein